MWERRFFSPAKVTPGVQSVRFIAARKARFSSPIKRRQHAPCRRVFRAAELAKRGYSVSLTMGNAKAVDLFAERDGKAICIQVKALARRRNVGWPLPHDRSKITKGVLYVCVILNGSGETPTYHVLPPEEVQQRGRWYRTRAILNIGDLRGSSFEGAWHLVEAELNKAKCLPI